MKQLLPIFCLASVILLLTGQHSTAQMQTRSTEAVRVPEGITLTPVASNLNNPRGVAIMPSGDMLVVEAGTGRDTPEEITGSGRILQLIDGNNDGDFDDPSDERRVRLDNQPSFNSLRIYQTGHDEPFGLSDILLMPDDRVLFTRDHPFAEAGRNTGGEGYYGDVGIFVLNTQREGATRLLKRSATLNSFAYDAVHDRFYITESGYNQVMVVSAADMENSADIAFRLPPLARGQQAVPAGIAVDPTTGDVLVALLSGFIYDYPQEGKMGFMPGDAKVVRFDPETEQLSDELTNLTTAIDVTTDDRGNVFIVELTTRWPPVPMPFDFDLTDPTARPDPGGYARFSGRVTMIPVDGSAPVVLADGLDTPTNITFYDESLYISTGLGTPGRNILSPDGVQPVTGIVYRLSGF
jgi:DNA-binding beta-propeller fold protein YncE